MSIYVSNAFSTVVLMAFGAWLGLSAIAQLAGANNFLDRLLEPIRAKDKLALLPAWTFFAPRPGQTDIHLLYRDLSEVSSISCWHETLTDTGFSIRESFWDPRKRSRKILVDFAQGLMEKSTGDSLGHFRLTGEYICILNYVVHLESTPFATRRQFAIVETPGDALLEPIKVIFVSDVHPIETSSAEKR